MARDELGEEIPISFREHEGEMLLAGLWGRGEPSNLAPFESRLYKNYMCDIRLHKEG